MIKVGDSMYGRFYSMFESPDIMKYLQYVRENNEIEMTKQE